ncbi:MAG TPA: MaoC family dehydratase [Sphingobium sp.]|uniref:MaoC family dehydratase n=1 Tax=Sphingobium sp. TaxID=1912891 RepID=UPI002ED3669D
MNREEITIDALRALIGKEIGLSRWFDVDQARISDFARVTEDEQFIHVDPVRAAATTFGGTIAHGFLSVSLLAPMSFDAQPMIEGQKMAVNYGFDRLRLINPVPSGSRVRGRFLLEELTARGPAEYMMRTDATVEIEGLAKPALKAAWLTIIYI